MTYTVTRREDQDVNIWSGGKTIQLFLHPHQSSYTRRDFLVRVSSATVEQDTSDFTSLPGFHRILMPLSGTIKLVYEGHGETLIKPYETAEFDGGWNTVSHGKCTDIGIMLAQGWQGSLTAAGQGAYSCKEGFTGVYALADHVKLDVNSGGESFSQVLAQGDFFLIETASSEAAFTLSTSAALGAIITHVWQG